MVSLNATNYHTVFEVSRTGGGLLGFILVPLLFLLAGVGIVRGWIQFRAKKFPKIIGYFFIFFFLFMEVSVIWDAVRVYSQLESALRNGQFHIVEGPVENFEPMNDWVKKRERFTVGGIRFTYSDYIVDQCFNHSSTHGGPIRAGLFVRVSYLDNCILKLEVADGQEKRH
jgi:hypothetical protein